MLLTLGEYASSVVKVLSALTIFGQILALVLLILLFFPPRGRFAEWGRRHGMIFLFVVALIATLGSLYFSEAAGWTPCKLCWFQRIFMYPQALLLGLAVLRRDRGVIPGTLLLSAVGIVFSAVHYGEQVRAALQPADALVPCEPGGTSCAATPFFTFGYVTIPLMAGTAFLLLLLGAALLRRLSPR